jgi:hypothetical protein
MIKVAEVFPVSEIVSALLAQLTGADRLDIWK